MFRTWIAVVAAGCLMAGAPLLAQGPSDSDVSAELKWRVEQLRSRGRLAIGGDVLEPIDLAMTVYERSGFRPLWGDRAAIDSLLLAVVDVWKDGLDPEIYHLSGISALAQRLDGAPDASAAAELDMLSTWALVRMSHDLWLGRVEPEGPSSDPGSPWAFNGAHAASELADLVASRRVREMLDALRPKHFIYAGLQRALTGLYQIRAAGGWSTIAGGPALHPGETDVRVPALRRRLVLSGDLARASGEAGIVYDAALEGAVRAFQHRHGLNEDGIVGESTLEELNVPVERRIDQVRANLERARWVLRELPDTFVAVNVAGARVYLMRDGSVAYESRGIVGADYTRTPVFAAPMLYVDLNPTWTVPPGVVGEILGLVVRDPTYLDSQGFLVLDSAARPVDPTTVDFSRYAAEDFPYFFRQEPGPANTLGEIKLMFPNEHRVYLHDTPTRGLFAEEERLFSHGCIRLEDPLGLAELVLGEPERWNRASLRAAIDSGATRTIRLAKPVPVFVLYWTAAVDQDGRLHFHKDVYGRDAALLAALDAP